MLQLDWKPSITRLLMDDISVKNCGNYHHEDEEATVRMCFKFLPVPLTTFSEFMKDGNLKCAVIKCQFSLPSITRSFKLSVKAEDYEDFFIL